MNITTTQKRSRYGSIIKAFLHTKLGRIAGFHLGIKGFNRVAATHTNASTGKQRFLGYAYNARVNKGADLTASLLTGTAINSIVAPLPPKFIAVSTTALTPAVGDTTLAGESTATGLARALGTIGTYVSPSALDGAASFTVAKTFTNQSGGSLTIQSAAIFDAVTVGNLFVEANLATAQAMAINDTIGITWTINL